MASTMAASAYSQACTPLPRVNSGAMLLEMLLETDLIFGLYAANRRRTFTLELMQVRVHKLSSRF